ncbi:mitochondrial import inner membrane translocase subunit TIM50-like [Hyla sarda]|uniref:mitochondrial import inner membrane translocase subunit TIM50-like n=1 Tax=Hyla sarda TaxID=327740 RepID=UPI0024C26A5A|nr:mitochondrial import inner membrane translocase subunit TIM50-like [Hyla sarda]
MAASLVPACGRSVRLLLSSRALLGCRELSTGLGESVTGAVLQDKLRSRQKEAPEDPQSNPESEEQQKKQKENKARAKKFLLRATGVLGLVGSGFMVYTFGSSSLDEEGNKVKSPEGSEPALYMCRILSDLDQLLYMFVDDDSGHMLVESHHHVAA